MFLFLPDGLAVMARPLRIEFCGKRVSERTR